MPNRSGRGSSAARSLDELDRAIIKQLQGNGRRAYAGMARDLGVPEATVRQRTERLVDRGVVQIVGVTDPLAMGFRQPAFIGMTVDANRIEEIAEQIGCDLTRLLVVPGDEDRRLGGQAAGIDHDRVGHRVEGLDETRVGELPLQLAAETG